MFLFLQIFVVSFPQYSLKDINWQCCLEKAKKIYLYLAFLYW